jgi:hypothetical protein
MKRYGVSSDGGSRMRKIVFVTPSIKERIRNIVFIMIGVAVLVFKKQYSGPFESIVYAYAGNVAVSFAVYFNALNAPVKVRYKQLWAAGLALAAVELFEVFDGFGIMSNVYDTFDLVANGVGVILALVVDCAWGLRQVKRSGRSARIKYLAPNEADATNSK